jgi:hypothetical protein
MIIAALTGLWYYLKSSESLWIYPYLYFAAGFFVASVMIVGLSLALIALKLYRLKALERLKNEKFTSTEKGYIDHAVNRAKADNEFNALLTEVAKEIENIGVTVNKATKKLELATGNPIKLQKRARETAAKLNKHSAKMEKSLNKLEQITELLIESDSGFINWFSPETEQQKEQLISQRQIYDGTLSTGQKLNNLSKCNLLSHTRQVA